MSRSQGMENERSALAYSQISSDGINDKEGGKQLKDITIRIFTLRCSGCSENIKRELKKIPGVMNIDINVVSKYAYIKIDPTKTSSDSIIFELKRINHVGVLDTRYETDSTTAYFKYCGNKRQLEEKAKSIEMSLNFIETGKDTFLSVSYEKRNIGIRKIYKDLYSVDNTITPVDYGDVFPSDGEQESKKWRKVLIVAAVFGIISMVYMLYEMVDGRIGMFMAAPGLSYGNLLLFICSTFVQIFVGRHLYISAYYSIFIGINMDFLICTATSIAYIYSCAIVLYFMIEGRDMSPHTFFETPGMLYLIVIAGRWIESKGKQHTVESIKNLMRPVKQIVTLVTFKGTAEKEFTTEEIDSSLIEETDNILIYSGMRIPSDGFIYKITGTASINESIITGESMPVQKEALSEVLSGSINEGVNFTMKVTRTGEDCRIQQISRCVQMALSKKIPISNVVNTVSKYFTPTICLLSIITFASWMIIFKTIPNLHEKLKIHSGLEYSFQAAISVLCVACPCALGLAVPLAIMISTGVAAKYGVFIKGGPPMQLLSKVKKIIFDKTGTLTFGKPKVDEFIFNRENDNLSIPQLELISLIYSTVANSKHVLSVSIRDYIEKEFKLKDKIELKELTEVPGKGIVAKYHSEKQDSEGSIVLGNETLMVENNISISSKIKDEVKNNIAVTGSTVVFVAYNQSIAVYIVLSDEIRPDALYTIQSLRYFDIEPVILTGDRQETAQFVANALGIKEVYAQASPEEKSKVVGEFCDSGIKVAMVGDGINDIIAISKSTVGIAMGSGTDVTAESANVVLMSNKLHDLLNLIVLSTCTIRAITRNLVLSSLYNLLSVPIAAGCLKWAGVDIQPWIASIAMVVSSLSVIGSSMLLKFFKPPFDGSNDPYQRDIK